MKKNSDAKLEQKVETVMISKIHIIVSIIAVMVPIIGFFFKIQLDVALIKNNHAAHTQAALEQIAELKSEMKNLEEKLDTDHDAIVVLLEHIKK